MKSIRRCSFLTLFLFILTLSGISPSPALVIEKSLGDLTTKAERIVIGRVTGIESRWEANRTQIWTQV